jgi:hypothetical protein
MSGRSRILRFLGMAFCIAAIALVAANGNLTGQEGEAGESHDPAATTKALKALRSQVDVMREQLGALDRQLDELETQLSGRAQSKWSPGADEFLALYNNFGMHSNVTASLGLFTLDGAKRETLRPIDQEANHVVVDPVDGRLYAVGNHRIVELDRETLELSELPIDPKLPELSWPCGMAFDTARRRVVVASLGGEGYLYAFDTRDRQWSLLGSLQNLDLAALAYDAARDEFLGLQVEHAGGAKLISFTAAGAQIGSRDITNEPAARHLDQFGCQLAVLGDRAVILGGQQRARRPDAPSEFQKSLVVIELREKDLTHERFSPINLQAWANQSLNGPFHLAHMTQNNLRELPQGQQTLDGVAFDIGSGCIQLAGTWMGDVPASTEAIPVARRAARLHFLHATGWGEGAGGRADAGYIADGTQIARYVVRYTDGESTEIPVVYGRDLRGWWKFFDDLPDTTAKIAWEGMNGTAREWGVSLRLYHSTWENPRKDAEIESIQFESMNDSIAAPFVVGLTAEQD